MAHFTPLSDRVAVRPDPVDETTESGLIIPDSAQEKPQRGTVIAVGPGRIENGSRIEMSVREGDAVLYGPYAGTEITMNGKDVLILHEDDLFGRIEEA
jgi:chaperonin GroES